MADAYLTPPELARRWRCTPETILAHIRAGRLRAFTLSPPTAKRPRWRIASSAVEEFENVHTAQQPVKSPRRSRRKRDAGYVEYV